MKTYLEIKGITMAGDNSIDCVSFYAAPLLNDVTYSNGEIEQRDLLLTKASVIERCAHVVVNGYGCYSGKKLWQLPEKIKAQIKLALRKHELNNE